MSFANGGQLKVEIVIAQTGDGIEIVKTKLLGLQGLAQSTATHWQAVNTAIQATPLDPVTALAQGIAGANNQAKTFAQSMSSLSQQGKNALQGIATGAPQAIQNLALVNKQVNSLHARMSSFAATLHDHALAFGVAATSVWGLYNAFDNLRRLELSTERIQIQAARLRNTAAIAEDRLSANLAKGKLNAEQAANAQQKVNIMRERAAVSTKIAEHDEEELQKAYAGMASQTLPLFVTMGASMAQFFSSMHINLSNTKAAIIGFGASFKDVMKDIPNMAKVGAAAFGSIGKPVGLPKIMAGSSGAAAAATEAERLAKAMDLLVGKSATLSNANALMVASNVRVAGSSATMSVAQVALAIQTGALTEAEVVNQLVTANMSRADAMAVASKLAQAGATSAAIGPTLGLSAATQGLSKAMLSLLTNPVFLILASTIMIVAGVAGMFASNMWGVRDALGGVGKAIGDFIPGLRPVLEGLSFAADEIGKIMGFTSEEAKPNVAVFGAFQHAAAGLKGVSQDVTDSMDDMSTSVQSSSGEMSAGVSRHFAEIKETWQDSKLELNKTSDLSPFKEVPDEIRKSWSEKIPSLKNVMIEAMSDVSLQSKEKLVSLKDFVANKIKELEGTTAHGTGGSDVDQALLDRLKHIKEGLALVQTEAGNYKITMGTLAAVGEEAAVSQKDLEAANLANMNSMNGATGAFERLDNSAQQVIFDGHKLSVVWQEDWPEIIKNAITDVTGVMKSFTNEQAAVGEIAESIWPVVTSQIADASDPKQIEEMVKALEMFKEGHKDLAEPIDAVIEKLKRYGEINFDPVKAGIQAATAEWQNNRNEIQMNIEKQKELFRLTANATGMVIPPTFKQTPENQQKVESNRGQGLPDLQGLDQMDDDLSQLINKINESKQAILDMNEPAQRLGETIIQDAIATQDWIAANTNIKAIFDGSAESLLKTNEARQQGIDKVKESIESSFLSQTALQSELDTLREANDGFTTYGGAIEDNIDNQRLFAEASAGSVEAAEELDKVVHDGIVGISAAAEATDEMANSLIESAREAGGMANEINFLKDTLNGAAQLTDSFAISTANATTKIIEERAAAGALGPTMAQTASATASGAAMAQQFLAETGQAAANEAEEIKVIMDALVAAGVDTVGILKALGVTQANMTLGIAKMIASAHFGVPGAVDSINKQMQQFAKQQHDASKRSSGGGGGGGGGGGSNKQKIDEVKLREQAVQTAIKEVEMYSNVIKSNREETKSIRELALSFGVAESAIKKFNKGMSEFETTTNKSQIALLKLTLTQARNLDLMNSQTQATKDLLNAQIEGAGAAQEFERNARMDAAAGKEELDMLKKITQELGISLPTGMKATVDNFHLLIEAAYGSEEALEDLKDAAMEVDEGAKKLAEFFGDAIDEAKSAIKEGHFSDFVKRELLFSQGADAFTSKIQVKVESEVKLEDIGEQMKKQLALINMDPEMFNKTMNDADLKGGVQRTIESINQAIGNDPKLKQQWQPMVDALQGVLAAPDTSEALVAFAKKFPDMLGPAVTGVELAMKGLDTTINQTLKNDGSEKAKELSAALGDVDKHADKAFKKLLKEAKEAQKAMGGMTKAASDFGDLASGFFDKGTKGVTRFWHETEESRKRMAALRDEMLVGGPDAPGLVKNDKGKQWPVTSPFNVTNQPKGPDNKGGILTQIVSQASAIPPAIDKAKISVTAGTNAMVTGFTAAGTSVATIPANITGLQTTVPAEINKVGPPATDAWGKIGEAIKTYGGMQAYMIGASFAQQIWGGLNAVWGGIQAANKWIEDNLITPISTFNWSEAFNATLKFGQQILSGLTIAIGDFGAWIDEHIISPITTYPWSSAIETVAGWGQIFVDTIGQGILDATGWIQSNIIDPVTGYDWKGMIDTVSQWGQDVVDTVGGGVSDATSWIQSNIVDPVTGYDWKGMIDTVSQWGQDVVDTVGGGVSDATSWVNDNIVTPVTDYPWKESVDAVSQWGQDVVDTVSTGVSDATSWINDNIVTPVTDYPWKQSVDTVSQWGQDVVDTVGGGVSDATSWVNDNIVTPVTDYPWKESVDAVSQWGQDVVDVVSTGVSDATSWVNDNIVTPVTDYPWKESVDAVKDWGQDTVDVVSTGVTSATGWIQTKIVDLVKVFGWQSAIDTIKAWGGQTMTVIASGITAVGTWVQKNIATPISNAQASFLSGLTSLSKWGTDVLTQIAKSLTFENISAWIKTNIIDNITKFDFGAALGTLGQWIGDALSPKDAEGGEKKDGDKKGGSVSTPSTPSAAPDSNAWNKWMQIATGAIVTVTTSAKNFVTTMSTYFGKTIPAVMTTGSGAFDATFRVGAQTAMIATQNTAKLFVTTMSTYFSKTLPTVLNTGKVGFDTFKTGATTAIVTTTNSAKNFITTMTTYFTKTMPSVLNTAKGAFDTFRAGSTTAMVTITNSGRNFVTTMSTYLTKTLTGAINTAKGAFDSLKSTSTSNMNSITSAARTFSSNMKSEFDKVGTAAGNAAGEVKKLGTAVDNLPKSKTITVDVKKNDPNNLISDTGDTFDTSLAPFNGGLTGDTNIQTHAADIIQNIGSTIQIPKPIIHVRNNPSMPKDAGKTLSRIIHHAPFNIEVPVSIDGKTFAKLIREWSLTLIDQEL